MKLCIDCRHYGQYDPAQKRYGDFCFVNRSPIHGKTVANLAKAMRDSNEPNKGCGLEAYLFQPREPLWSAERARWPDMVTGQIMEERKPSSQIQSAQTDVRYEHHAFSSQHALQLANAKIAEGLTNFPSEKYRDYSKKHDE